MDTIIKHTFNFENSFLRVIGEPETPWFFAKDICNMLGLSNVTRALATIPEKYKGITAGNTLGGVQNMLIVSEPGLYQLIIKSKKKEAVKFQEWIFEELEISNSYLNRSYP